MCLVDEVGFHLRQAGRRPSELPYTRPDWCHIHKAVLGGDGCDCLTLPAESAADARHAEIFKGIEREQAWAGFKIPERSRDKKLFRLWQDGQAGINLIGDETSLQG